MTDFFTWWHTNSDGKPYMNLLECSMNDTWVIASTVILCIWIVWQYIDVAVSAYQQSKGYEPSITKKYLLNKVNVFVFCAITGYGYTILSVFVNPYKFRLVLLLILGIWTFKFRKSIKRTNVLKRIFDSEKMIQQKLSEAKRMKTAFSTDNSITSVTFEQLENSEYNVWTNLNGNGVRFMRLYHPDKPVFYITEMDPEKSNTDVAEFGIHLHDCIELGNVIKGHMIDDVDGKEYTEADMFQFEPNQKHRPKASMFSIYEVEFKEL